MKLSKTLLASLLVTSVGVGCNKAVPPKTDTKCESMDSSKTTDVKRPEGPVDFEEGCPACGMG